MTLIDHKLFCALDSEYEDEIVSFFFFIIDEFILLIRELLLQGWMKPDRDDLAPNVALVSRRFNEVNSIFRNKQKKLFSLFFFV
jgi:hypothetical protein